MAEGSVEGGGTELVKDIDGTGKTRIARCLMGLATAAYYHSWLVVVLAFLSAGFCVYYAATSLFFDADRANLINRRPELQARQDTYARNFPAAEELVVIVEGGSEPERKQFVDDLGSRLREESDTFAFVFEKTEVSFLQNRLLQYLDVDGLREATAGIEGNIGLFRTLARANSIADLVGQSELFRVSSMRSEHVGLFLPIINDFIRLLRESMETRGRYVYYSPWKVALLDKALGSEEGAQDVEVPDEFMQSGPVSLYNTVAKGRIYLLVCRPAYSDKVERTESIARAVERLRTLLHNMARSHRNITVSLTGELVLDLDEAECSTRDSMHSSIISLVLVSLLFAWAFREVYRPLLSIGALVVGIAWTMGFTTLVIGHLNLITVTFATILVGLGVDFGIHFIYRYDEEKHTGYASLPAMQLTLAGAGSENFTGAVSTAFAFFALNLTGDSGISELGTIAGSGMLFCFLSMALVLPALLFLLERMLPQSAVQPKTKACASVSRFAWLARGEKELLRRAGLVLLACSLFTLWCVWEGRVVHYDYNLLNLQAEGLDSVKAELHLINSSDYSLLQAVSLCDNVAEVERLSAEYSKLPTVSKVESVGAMIPGDYEKKYPYLNRIVTAMSTIPNPPPDKPKTGSMVSEMRQMGRALEKADAGIDQGLAQLKQSKDEDVASEASELEDNLQALFTTLSSMGPGPIEDGLRKFESDFFADFHGTFRFLKRQVDGPELTLDDLPRELREREIGKEGKIQLRVFPKENVWERPALERFVRSVEKVDPQVIGMPIVTYYDTETLRKANEKAGIYALVAIWILLLVHFRSIKVALLAAFPKIVGIVWMVGVMGFCGVNFNSANFLALPLILGIGLVFGIHVVHRIMEEGEGGVFSHSTGPAIALAATTTIVGFGTLILASHQGVASLGIIMSVGVASNLLTSIVFLPALLVWLDKFGWGVSQGKGTATGQPQR